MEEVSSLYFTKKKELANREFKYFDGADENCQAFNNEQMWNMEQVNSYNGFSGLDSRNIRGFHNASGCGTGYNASGRSASNRPYSIGLTYGNAERQTGGNTDCGGECTSGSIVGAVCDEGCVCRNDKCVPAPYRQGGVKPQVNRKSRRGSVDRISAKPVRGGRMNASGRSARRSGRDRISVAPVGGAGRESGACQPTKCGQHHGASCPAGCICSSTLNGVCKSGYGGTGGGAKVKRGAKQMNFSHHSNFSAPARGFSPVERVFPYGTGNYFNGGSTTSCGLDRR